MSSLQRCHVRDPRPRCYAAAARPIAAREVRLDGALAAALEAAASPGCRELAGAALRDAAAAAALAAFARDGAHADLAALRSHAARIAMLDGELDAPGFLTRFVGLCA